MACAWRRRAASQRIAEDPREPRSRHLERAVQRAPLVAVVEHHADPSCTRERREQELRKGRTADEHGVVAPRGEPMGEDAEGGGLPEDLRVGKERLLCDLGERAHATGPGRAQGRAARPSCLGAPRSSLQSVARLERPGALDLDPARQVAQQRSVVERDAGVSRRQDRGPHPVMRQVFGELDHALHASAPDGREAVRNEQNAKVHAGVPLHLPIPRGRVSRNPSRALYCSHRP